MSDMLLTGVTGSPSAVDNAFRKAFGTRISGITKKGNNVVVHFLDDYTAEDEVTATQVSANKAVESRPVRPLTVQDWMTNLTTNWEN